MWGNSAAVRRRRQMETFSAFLVLLYSTGHRRIPLTKTSDAELWYFFFICAWTNGWAINRVAGDFRRHRVHYDVSVMAKCRYFGLCVVQIVWDCDNCTCVQHIKSALTWCLQGILLLYILLHHTDITWSSWRSLRWRHNGRGGVTNH